MEVEAGEVWEINIGAGGQPSRLPGQHSAPGSDTAITIKSADGKVKHIHRVRGGAGSKSGALPDDWVTISEVDLRSGFQISTLLLADSLEFRGGVVYVNRGGWSKLFPSSLPFDTIWKVLCIATWERLAPGYTRGVQLCLSDPRGREVSRLALELPVTASNEHSWIWWSSLGAPLDREGRWRVSAESGEFLLSEITVHVEVPKQQT
jgi:hypothetical protein